MLRAPSLCSTNTELNISQIISQRTLLCHPGKKSFMAYVGLESSLHFKAQVVFDGFGKAGDGR